MLKIQGHALIQEQFPCNRRSESGNVGCWWLHSKIKRTSDFKLELQSYSSLKYQSLKNWRKPRECECIVIRWREFFMQENCYREWKVVIGIGTPNEKSRECDKTVRFISSDEGHAKIQHQLFQLILIQGNRYDAHVHNARSQRMGPQTGET